MFSGCGGELLRKLSSALPVCTSRRARLAHSRASPGFPGVNQGVLSHTVSVKAARHAGVTCPLERKTEHLAEWTSSQNSFC